MSNDPVNPDYYPQGGDHHYQVAKRLGTHVEYLGYLRWQCMKYLWRLWHKPDPLIELRKAEWYLQKLIEDIEERGVPDEFKRDG